MTDESPSDSPAQRQAPSERFSLVAGGPFHALCLRCGLTTPSLGGVGRRSAAFAALA